MPSEERESNKPVAKKLTKKKSSGPRKQQRNRRPRKRNRTNDVPNRNANAKAVDRKIIINAEPWEVRVAYLENDTLAELYVERVAERRSTGNIYLGKVVRVLPGMQAAFVDIGLERTAFLYVSEVADELSGELVSEQFEMDDADTGKKKKADGKENEQSQQIQDLLKEGQEVLVQVTKDPIGTKGARLTCHLSLPGRSVVYMPKMNHVGISRRIPSDRERRRLRDVVTKIKKDDEGIIVRTAGEGQKTHQIRNDVQFLRSQWAEIQKRTTKKKPPALIYNDLSLAMRSIRDLLNDEVSKIVVDDQETYDEINEFLKICQPERQQILQLHETDKPVFDKFSLEPTIARAMEKKVWLKSGGYLIIEQTEALVAIDVNTGRYVGKSNIGETILRTNLEAVNEIVKQLRFRNIGGIIILDFIDMDRAADREKVYKHLEEALTHDKARTNISKITSLGLVEMTRKRTQENIGMALTEECGYCKGKGRVKSSISICYEIFRALQRDAASVEGDRLSVNVHPAIANILNNEEKTNLALLEQRLGKRIYVIKDHDLHIETFEVHA